MTMSGKNWSKHLGKKVLDLSGEFPVAVDAMAQLDKGVVVRAHEISGSDDLQAEEEG